MKGLFTAVHAGYIHLVRIGNAVPEIQDQGHDVFYPAQERPVSKVFIF